MRDWTGLTIRNYRVVERIAHNWKAVVYRAENVDTDETVALKVLYYSPEAEDVDFRRFELEVRLTLRLRHPYIVPLLDSWSDTEGIAIAMRWMAGGSLRTLIQQGPLSLTQVIHMVDRISEALAKAHRNQIIHRDLKPDNILYDEMGHAHLSDFGIAKRLNAEPITASNTTIGSPAYLAPEQVAKTYPLSPQTDVYALAFVVYEALTGVYPYGEMRAPMIIILKHLRESIPPLSAHRPGLPPALDEVLARATDKIPGNRHASILDFAQQLRRSALGE